MARNAFRKDLWGRLQTWSGSSVKPSENQCARQRLKRSVRDFSGVAWNFRELNSSLNEPMSLPFRRHLLALLALFGAAADSLATVAETVQPPTGRASYILRQIIITENADSLKELDYDPTKGFVVLKVSVAAVEEAEMNRRLKAGENRVIDEQLLAAVAAVVASPH